jgi:hypothetical protein
MAEQKADQEKADADRKAYREQLQDRMKAYEKTLSLTKPK